MANICEYKVMVKGKKSNCYAMLGVLPKYDDNIILREEGDSENYVIVFSNTCRWALSYTQRQVFDGTMPENIPDDPYEAERKFGGMYWEYNMPALSKMFDVEIWYNSADIDEMTMLESGHCKEGKMLGADYPDELRLDEQGDMAFDDELGNAALKINEITNNLFAILPQETLLEIANSLEAVNEPLDAVTPEELGSMLFVEYTMFYMGVHPGDFVSEFLEDYGLIEDEMKEQVEAAIWDVFE